jgi:outer membrane immunogenic protein
MTKPGSQSVLSAVKSLLLGAGSSLVLAVSAQAADLPLKAPPRVAAPVFSWTGCYAGGNAGYSWGRARGDADSETVGAFSTSSRPNGFIGGGQIGCNWQRDSNWFWGVEADFQGSAEKARHDLSRSFTDGEGTSTFSNTLEARIRWFGTLRARAGALITPTLLLYGTGGLAYGNVKLTDTITINNGTTSTTVISQSNTKAGWTVGAGLEGVFWGNVPSNWTWKLEYLYIDLGRFSGSGVDPLGVSFSWNTRVTDNILRVGINYKFR